jgi:hypothetical protein
MSANKSAAQESDYRCAGYGARRFIPQQRPACRGNVWRHAVHTDVLQNLSNLGPVGDEGDEAHLAAAQWSQQRQHLVDAGNQHRPQVVRW